jgi:PilZ domain
MSTERWKAQIAVEFLGRNQSSVLLTDSVSARSVFVRTDAPPPPMTLLRVQFLLPPDDARLVIPAMVANTVLPTSAHAVPGVEIAFFGESGQANQRWGKFIAHLRKTHPESVDRPVMLARDVAEAMDRYALVDGFRSVDVSPSGMFVATTQRFVVGSDVRVTLIDVASKEERSVDCVVRRRATRGEQGIAVEYRNMTGETWTDLVAFLRGADGARALRAEIQVVRTPYVPMTMQTLPGPWSSDAVPPSRPEPPEDSWSLPPENGWS